MRRAARRPVGAAGNRAAHVHNGSASVAGQGPVEDRVEVDAVGQCAEGVSPVAAEPGGAEGVGDGSGGVPDQEGALKGEGHQLHQPPGAGLRPLSEAPPNAPNCVRA